jgi:hypothetical protein
MTYGEPNTLSGGGTLTPLNLRYFVSNVALVRGDASLVSVDMVTSTGTPEPYGVHFVNAEDPASAAWRIRAPAGTYRGMQLILGLSDACNANGSAFAADTQLTWPPPFGYLFLRFEAHIGGVGPIGGGAAGGLQPVDAIAMGGFIGWLYAPIVHVDGALIVPGSGPVLRHLRLDMDQVFKGATANVDVSRHPPAPPAGAPGTGPNGVVPNEDEIIAGERLRQTAPQLPLFVLDP